MGKTEISVHEQCYDLECPLKTFFKIQLQLEFNFDITVLLLAALKLKICEISLTFQGFSPYFNDFLYKIQLYVIGYNTQFQFDQRLKKRVFLFRTAVLNKSVLFNHYFSHIRNRSVWVFVIYR